MAKKPAESEESQDDTGSASEASGDAGSQDATGSQSEVSEASGHSTLSDDGSKSDAASDASGASDAEESQEAAPKKGASGRAKRATGKHSAVKPSTRAAPRPVGSGHELVPVICSECYEELVFDSGVKSDVLTCPICEHQAARPDDAQLAIIAEKRGQEKKNFMVGLILCVVSMAAFAVWIWLLRNPHTNATENGPGFYGPVAVSGLAYLGCLVFTLSKYEGARHDVYF
ncbi:MAG TPA: hypothetical protein VFF73_08165 [Planctomycetota bacterium]|nr:hypothetical protein [Planctomycetota bacterium]